MKSIALFSSGGDSPGMNACIRAVVRTGIYHGLKVWGIEQGLNGLISGKFNEMNNRSVANIIQRGGTVLKTARSEKFRTKEGRELAYKQLQKFKVDALVAIGGDGTYTAMHIFYEEFGVPTIGLPGTIDNDLSGTDYTIGYDTAVNTAMEAIDKIRDTAESHDRTFLVEVMGRHAGFIALDVGLAGGAEAILVPEVESDMNALAKLIQGASARKKSFQIVIVAEGDDTGGADVVAKKLKEHIPGFDCRIVILGHIQRGGSPTANDRNLASRLGAASVEALLAGKKDVAIGIVNGTICHTPLMEAVEVKKPLNSSLFELAHILGL